MGQPIYAPGARVVVRDAEWLVRRVDSTSTGGKSLHCVGLSEIVKDKDSIFLTELEPKIELLDPTKTKFKHDTSSQYQASMLYLESQLRQSPPTDDDLYIGHRAAMDTLPFQLKPALAALHQPRQRILIADAVGLGKTLEAGILLSELIKRGRGKRIMVVAIKSMLTQFQKEMWSRFTIPLTRLDSTGLQRIRTRIPTNHNPFYYYDRSIISIDTLKQNNEYRNYLEQAYWDIIVIDEAHNVADRGTSALRNILARRLAKRSDTLIMLSATPHDGRPESFASLMNMLDPTAIPDPANYTKDDIRGLYIRRYKKDIVGEVSNSFKEREILKGLAEASSSEETAYQLLTTMTFQKLDSHKNHRSALFKTVLQKSLFSSPAACHATILNRLKKIEKQVVDLAEKKTPEALQDIKKLEQDREQLEALRDAVADISPEQFSKYQFLLNFLKVSPPKGLGWKKNNPEDRLVIFTERRETLSFLKEHLARDLKLKYSESRQNPDKDQILELHGGMSDTDQQKIVEVFGQEKMPVKVLVCSDVASEGINLHYLSHRMIHFDIPWSLMVFQQRNGRIDRYGQEETPQITYLITNSQNEDIKGDNRILEVLIEKDKQADKNIGDPSAFMKVYDVHAEELVTAKAIEERKSAEEFDAELDPDRPAPSEENNADSKHDDLFGWMNGSFDSAEGTEEQDPRERCQQMPSLFEDDYAYLKQSLSFLQHNKILDLQVSFDDDDKRVSLTAPPELKQRFRYLPREIWPELGGFQLSQRLDTINKEIKESRKSEHAWPSIHYLWELHPIMAWASDRISTFFGRQEAPAILLPEGLEANESVLLLTGVIPNRKSHPLIFRWLGVRFINDKFVGIETLDQLLQRTRLDQHSIPNTGQDFDTQPLQSLTEQAVAEAERYMQKECNTFQQELTPKLQEHLDMLKKREQTHLETLDTKFANASAKKMLQYKEQRNRIEKDINDYKTWVFDTMQVEAQPYLQIVAALVSTT